MGIVVIVMLALRCGGPGEVVAVMAVVGCCRRVYKTSDIVRKKKRMEKKEEKTFCHLVVLHVVVAAVYSIDSKAVDNDQLVCASW